MQNRTEKLAAAPHPRFLRSSSATYLAKVALVLQEAPDKMLTFSQLMDKMAPCFPEDRKPFENNIRVCLSSNKCFIKIPMVLGSTQSKRNYWKLDCSQITAKMVRRHFKGILQLFPELASKVETENASGPAVPCSAVHSPGASACRSVPSRPVKFSGPFSIESLLKRSPPARGSRASPLSSLQVGAEQHPGRSLVCSPGGATLHGLAADGATAHVRGRHPRCDILFPGYTAASAAPYFSSYITHPVPAFTHDALYFRL
ncbi:forkhead box protein H1 [Betta splendens]|uniref:Forkhead box protein H1 n=1 Tax=Betta splendens TaxID=158456 RepID=A0A6P7P0B7_BETSP|nr:forkhead box protein H1 [Betta splendens]